MRPATVSEDHISVLTDEMLSAWCRRTLGAGLDHVLFRRRHLSEVIAARLTDGRQVVVKARSLSDRLAGCLAVQAALADAGFPCPVPVTGLSRIDEYAVTAETLIPGGDPPA